MASGARTGEGRLGRKLFIGEDKDDLDQQQWEWLSHAKRALRKEWPDETIQVLSQAPKTGEIELRERVSRLIEYDD